MKSGYQLIKKPQTNGRKPGTCTLTHVTVKYLETTNDYWMLVQNIILKPSSFQTLSSVIPVTLLIFKWTVIFLEQICNWEGDFESWDSGVRPPQKETSSLLLRPSCALYRAPTKKRGETCDRVPVSKPEVWHFKHHDLLRREWGLKLESVPNPHKNSLPAPLPLHRGSPVLQRISLYLL